MLRKEKSNIEKLNEIRNFRNEQIKQFHDNSIFVTKVESLGKGKQTGSKIFRLIEEHQLGENEKEIYEIFYIYDKELELKAVRNPNTFGEIVPIGINGDEQEKWNIEKNDIEQCLEEREKLLKTIAKELGINEDDINSLSEIDLEQKIVGVKEELNTNEKLDEEENETKTLTQEQVNKLGGNSKNEVQLDSLIDSEGTTLGEVLGLEEYEEIKIIPTYKLSQFNDDKGNKGQVNNLQFGILGKRKDSDKKGNEKYEVIPEEKLRPYRGQNREVAEINNKENVEMKNEEYIYEAPGTNKRLVISQKDPYGIPDIYLAQNTHDNEGNVAQKLQDRYAGSDRTDVEVRALFDKDKGEYKADEMHEELKEHEEAGCENKTLNEVDGDKTTGHQHLITVDSILEYNGKQATIEEIAKSPRFKISPEEFVIKYNKIIQRNNEVESEKIYDEVEEEVNGDLINPQQH